MMADRDAIIGDFADARRMLARAEDAYLSCRYEEAQDYAAEAEASLADAIDLLSPLVEA